MLVFILNSIKAHAFASFEYVSAVVLEYFLQIADSNLIKGAITIYKSYSFLQNHYFFDGFSIALTLLYFHLVDFSVDLGFDALFDSGVPKS